MLSIDEIAAGLNVSPETVRRVYQAKGHYLHLLPIKDADGRLVWPDLDENDFKILIND